VLITDAGGTNKQLEWASESG